MAENYFDDAKEKVLAEMDAQNGNNEAGTEEGAPAPTAESAPSGENTQETSPTAEGVAAQADPYDVISQQSSALGDAVSRIQSYKSEIERLKSQIAEQNAARREEIIENAAEDELKMPVPPDFTGSDYMSDEERNRAWTDFIGKSTEYAIAAARKEYQPYIDAAKEGRRAAEEQSIIEQMSRPESGLPGFADELPTIKRVLSENPLFKNSDDVESNYLNAYLLAKGGKSFEPKTALTDDDLKLMTEQQMMNLYDSNPDFQRAVAKRLQESLKDGQSVPQFAASGDTSNSAVANEEAPVKTFEEAAKRMKRYL